MHVERMIVSSTLACILFNDDDSCIMIFYKYHYKYSNLLDSNFTGTYQTTVYRGITTGCISPHPHLTSPLMLALSLSVQQHSQFNTLTSTSKTKPKLNLLLGVVFTTKPKTTHYQNPNPHIENNNGSSTNLLSSHGTSRLFCRPQRCERRVAIREISAGYGPNGTSRIVFHRIRRGENKSTK